MRERFEPDRPVRHLVESLEDRYEFLGLLGEGGSGTVFEVRNRALQRPEALKVLTGPSRSQDDARRFSHEAMIAASLDHPNIVRIHAFGQDEGLLWYSMQLVEGPTLAAILDGGSRLDGAMLVRLALPILAALAFSHARGVIHRDIKPANILFDLKGQPFLADFGIAKTSENVLLTRTGQFLGTPAYVAPEQAMGEPVDARADLYALGATLYRAVAGQLPFKSEGLLQTLMLRLQEPPEPLADLCPGLDPGLAGVVMRALARNREDRFGGATEMRAAFLQAAAAAGIVPDLDEPLAILRAFPPARQAIPPDPGRGRRRPGALETTADLPLPPWRQLRVGAGVLGAAALALAFWIRRPVRAAALPPAPAVQAPPPRAAVPAPAPRPPARVAAPARPEPAPAPRRPVVYPQLIDAAPVPAGPVPCAGLSVAVSLLVGEDGLVKTCKVLSPVGPECAGAARAVARQYHFRPALDALGQPVQTTLAVAVLFPEPR